MKITLRPALPLLLAAACLEHHAPSETSPVEFDHVNVEFDGPTGLLPTVFLEGATGVHVVYLHPDIFDFAFPGRATYAGCAGGCEDAARWTWGTLDTLVVSQPAAVLTSTGAQVAYVVQSDQNNFDSGVVRVAACQAECARPGVWHTVDLTATGAEGETVALTADASGALYLAFTDSRPTTGATRVGLLRCDTACATVGNWSRTTLDSLASSPTTFYPVYLSASALTVDLAGNVSLVYYAYRYQLVAGAVSWIAFVTCGPGCPTGGSPHVVTLDSSSAVYGWPTIVTTPGGVIVGFSRSDSTILMFCDAGCEDRHQWRSLSLGLLSDGSHFGARGVGLGVGPDGELHLAAQGTSLVYGRCLHSCDVAASWQAVTIDSGAYGFTDEDPSIAIDQFGNPRIAYHTGNLIFLSILR